MTTDKTTSKSTFKSTSTLTLTSSERKEKRLRFLRIQQLNKRHLVLAAKMSIKLRSNIINDRIITTATTTKTRGTRKTAEDKEEVGEERVSRENCRKKDLRQLNKGRAIAKNVLLLRTIVIVALSLSGSFDCRWWKCADPLQGYKHNNKNNNKRNNSNKDNTSKRIKYRT